ILPNTSGPVLVLATLDIGNAILTVAGLSFIGFGVPPPNPECGAMISEAQKYPDQWRLAGFPGLAIVTPNRGLHFFGDAVPARREADHHGEAGTGTPGEAAGEEGREGHHAGLGKQGQPRHQSGIAPHLLEEQTEQEELPVEAEVDQKPDDGPGREGRAAEQAR